MTSVITQAPNLSAEPTFDDLFGSDISDYAPAWHPPVVFVRNYESPHFFGKGGGGRGHLPQSNIAHQNWSDPLAAAQKADALIASHGFRGFGSDDVALVGIIHGPRLSGFAKAKWADAPFLFDPRWTGGSVRLLRPDRSGMSWSAVETRHYGGRSWRHDIEITRRSLRAAKVVVVDCSREKLDGLLLGLSRLTSWTHTDQGLPPIGWFDGTEYLPHVSARLFEIARLHRPEDRFTHNYRLNWGMLAERALKETVREVPHPGRYYVPFGTAEFEDPMLLQMLFAIRRTGNGIGTETGSESYPLYSSDRYPALLSAIPGVETDSLGSMTFTWAGTGTYKPWVEKLVRGQPSKSGFLFAVLLSGGLALIADDGRAQLTRRGAVFLNILPPELEDPDVLLRWRTSDGLMGSDADVPAMDRWLMRAFRALKRRVANLPATDDSPGTLRRLEASAANTGNLAG